MFIFPKERREQKQCFNVCNHAVVLLASLVCCSSLPHSNLPHKLPITSMKSSNFLSTHLSDGLNLLHPRKDVAEMVIVFCVSPSFLRVWCCGHEMSKWLKRSSSRSRSSRTSSSKRKSSSSSNEKEIVSYQQGSHFGALSVGMCL